MSAVQRVRIAQTDQHPAHERETGPCPSYQSLTDGMHLWSDEELRAHNAARLLPQHRADARERAQQLARAASVGDDPPGPTAQRRANNSVSPPVVNGSRRRPHWQIETRLDALSDAGLIDEPQWLAADRLRQDAARASGARAGCDYVRVDHQPASDGIGTAQIAAVTRVREAQAGLRSALGRRFASVIEVLPTALVEDWSWVQLGSMLGVGHETARDRAVAVIRELAEVYQAIDGPAQRRAA
jgi:hypothetical protein